MIVMGNRSQLKQGACKESCTKVGSERGQVKTRQQGNLEQAKGENPHRQPARRAGHGTTAQGGTALPDV